MRPLSVIQRYIGFDWHLNTKSVSVPIKKLNRTRFLVRSWLLDGYKAQAHNAASLHRKLVHISGIYLLIQPFLRSISVFTNSFQSQRAHLLPPSSVQVDLCWILSLLEILPDHLPLYRSAPIDLDWWGDASSLFGIRVTIGGEWAIWKYAPGVSVGPGKQFNIGWAETVAVELTLQLAISCNLLSPQHFLVRSNNAGVVSVLGKGRSQSQNTNTVLKSIYPILASESIWLSAIYVPSRLNVADTLSRGDIAAFLKGFPGAQTKSSFPLPKHLSNLLISL